MDELRYKRKSPFVMISHDFIKSDLLTWNEKDIYIILLMYADSEQKCFPSISTLCKVSGKSNKTVLKALKGLEDKNLLTKEYRITKNGQTSNLYTLHNFDDIWKSKTIEQVTKIVDIETKRKQLYALAKELHCTITEEKIVPDSAEVGESAVISEIIQEDIQTKVKEPVSTPTKDQTQATSNKHLSNNDNTPPSEKSQPLEKYSLDWIKQRFDYDILLHDNPYDKNNIDSVMDILYTTLNTTKETIRIDSEDKPTNVVIGKLMKLQYWDIEHTIKKFKEQKNRIIHPLSYILTILYHAREQNHLDVQNQVSHDMDQWHEYWCEQSKKAN